MLQLLGSFVLLRAALALGKSPWSCCRARGGGGGVPRPGPPGLIHPTAGPGPATRTPRRRRCPIATGPGAISTFPGLDSHVPSTTPTPLRQEHEPFRGFAPQDVAKLPSTRLLEHPHAQIRAEDAFWAGGDLDSPPKHTRFRSADSHQRRGEMVWELTWRHARASASRRHPAGKSPAGGWRRAGPRSGPAQLPPGLIPIPVPPPPPGRYWGRIYSQETSPLASTAAAVPSL